MFANQTCFGQYLLNMYDICFSCWWSFTGTLMAYMLCTNQWWILAKVCRRWYSEWSYHWCRSITCLLSGKNKQWRDLPPFQLASAKRITKQACTSPSHSYSLDHHLTSKSCSMFTFITSCHKCSSLQLTLGNQRCVHDNKWYLDEGGLVVVFHSACYSFCFPFSIMITCVYKMLHTFHEHHICIAL